MAEAPVCVSGLPAGALVCEDGMPVPAPTALGGAAGAVACVSRHMLEVSTRLTAYVASSVHSTTSSVGPPLKVTLCV